ncbi:hypothetical protein Q8F57_033180 [Paraburkholderia terrae]|uniref:hypothetical protein n=1 Tax=Paraburkholderia terrae TaxID=311230 RepID=UPI00296B3DB8|nr:hypothetical protein [Paraburkholderia terrae]MDW3657808.1 hypothetical protein [Paraburkholderia terrae]
MLLLPQAKRVRVVADFGVLVRAPTVGETWEVSGKYERHPAYGAQLQANSGRCRPPEGVELTMLMGKHPAFAGIGMRRAAKLWKKFESRLYDILENEEVISLHSAGIAASAALAAVSAWHTYIEDLRIGTALETLPLSGHQRSNLSAVIALFRGMRLASVYDFHPAIQWSTVDSAIGGTESREDPLRLLTACDSVLVRGGEAILRALASDEFERQLAVKFRDETLVEPAISSALLSGRLSTLTFRQERYYHSDGLGKITHAFLSRLLNINGPKNDSIDGVVRFGSHVSTVASVGLIDYGDLSNTAASDRLHEVFADALHVGFSYIGGFPGVHLTVSELLLLPAGSKEFSVSRVVVHTAHALDILCLNKLIRRLPDDAALILAGSDDVVHKPTRPAPFHALWHSARFDRMGLDAHTRSADVASAGSRCTLRNGPTIRQIQVEGEKATLEEALGQYRESVCGGSTVLIGSNAACHVLNVALALEKSHELGFDNLSPATVTLGRGGEACAQCPVTWKQADITKRRWPGESMHLHAVECPPYIQVTNTIPEQVVAHLLRASGEVTPVTARDAFELTLAYALELSTAALATWQTVIIVCTRDKGCTAEWLRAASGLASQTVVLVGDIETTLTRCGKHARDDRDPLLQHLIQQSL